MTIGDVLKAQMGGAGSAGQVDPTAGGYRTALADFAAKRKAAALASPSAAGLSGVLTEAYDKMGQDAAGRFNVGVGWQAQPANRTFQYGAMKDAFSGVRGDQDATLGQMRLSAQAAQAAAERDRVLREGRAREQSHGYTMQELGLRQEMQAMLAQNAKQKTLYDALASIGAGIAKPVSEKWLYPYMQNSWGAY